MENRDKIIKGLELAYMKLVEYKKYNGEREIEFKCTERNIRVITRCCHDTGYIYQ